MEAIPKFESKAEKVSTKILTPQEYADRREEFETPCLLEIESGGKKLVCVGSQHSADPNHPQFEIIKNKFMSAKPGVVFVEGIWNIQNHKEELGEYIGNKTYEEIIYENEENWGTVWLAHKSDVSVHSPEPSKAEYYESLQKEGFSKKEIFLLHLLQIIPQWKRSNHKNEETIEDYLKGKREELCAYFELSDEGSVLEQMQNYLTEAGIEIDLSDSNLDEDEAVANLVDPIPWDDTYKRTRINDAAAASSLVRDRTILRDLEEAFKETDTVFVVYGASHIHMLSDALRELMGSYKGGE